MKRMKLATLLTAVAAAVALPTTASAGLVWNEAGPFGAGDLLATAQTVADSSFNTLDEIRGALTATVPVDGGPIYQVDLYKFRIYDYVNFSARTVSANASDDTALYLFNSSGFGVYMNDDNAADLLSTLPSGDANGPLADGIYYLAVALGGYFANDAFSNSLFLAGGFSDVLGGSGNGPLAGWAPGFAAQTESPFLYDIVLTGATNDIPAPGSAALVLAGGLAAWLSRRRAPKVKALSIAAA